MLVTEAMRETWKPIMESDVSKEHSLTKSDITVRLLENQKKWCEQYLGEAAVPSNATGAAIANWTPVLIKMAKRVTPNLMAFDFFGVQPMTGPDGQVFAMRARYNSQTGNEALFNAPNTGFSGAGTEAGDISGFPLNFISTGVPAADPVTGTGMDTASAERLGATGGTSWGKMAVSIEKSSVTAKSRGLYADYSHELRQDMMAIHGEDVDTILAEILSNEIQAEMNMEFIRTMNTAAKLGGADGLVATQGKLDVQADTDGRWAVEKWKGLMFILEAEANAIARRTRRGKANVLLCSPNVASALQMAGMLDYTPAINANIGLNVDVTGQTFAGVLANGMKVYIDPYATLNYLTMGYKGTNQLDAGIFYCPYTPLEMYRAQGEDTFQPRMAFKTRYGIIANPFDYQNAAGVVQTGKGLGQGENSFYSKFAVLSLL